MGVFDKAKKAAGKIVKSTPHYKAGKAAVKGAKEVAKREVRGVKRAVGVAKRGLREAGEALKKKNAGEMRQFAGRKFEKKAPRPAGKGLKGERESLGGRSTTEERLRRDLDIQHGVMRSGEIRAARSRFEDEGPPIRFSAEERKALGGNRKSLDATGKALGSRRYVAPTGIGSKVPSKIFGNQDRKRKRPKSGKLLDSTKGRMHRRDRRAFPSTGRTDNTSEA